MTKADYIEMIYTSAQACNDLDLLDLILRIFTESGD